VEPLLNRNARVVMVTSGLGDLSGQSASLVTRISNPNLSLSDLERLAAEAPGGYGASKAALNAMARLFARELSPTAREVVIQFDPVAPLSRSRRQE
jgi:NAD(P)-dependent dehydrogenase (short-subunit alcohol dehydrogenase family)